MINKIITATGLKDCNPNWTPVASAALGIDLDGLPMNETWSYSLIIRMLLYLSMNTRPDITFAVSQVACFNHNPKQSHAQAVKMIVHYLSQTWDKSMIVKPMGDLQIDCCIDANFTGRDMGSVISDIRKELRAVPVPKDFAILFGGDYEEQQKANQGGDFGGEKPQYAAFSCRPDRRGLQGAPRGLHVTVGDGSF